MERKLWCDTLIYNQGLFKFVDKHNIEYIRGREGEPRVLKGDTILQLFPFDNELLSMPDIVNRLNLVKELPNGRLIQSYMFPRTMVHPKHCIPVHVPLTPLDKVDRDGKRVAEAVATDLRLPLKYTNKW